MAGARSGMMKPWVKGQSGNPSGRPSEYHKVIAFAREYSMEAVKHLVKHMRSRSPKISCLAAGMLLDRAYGKPHQAMVGEGGGPVKLVVSWQEPKSLKQEPTLLLDITATDEPEEIERRDN